MIECTIRRGVGTVDSCLSLEWKSFAGNVIEGYGAQAGLFLSHIVPSGQL